MDIIKSKPSLRKSPWLYISGGILVCMLISAFIFRPQAARTVERNSLLFGTVQRGELKVTVDGYGVLRSDKQKLITALNAATVEEVLLRPGAQVEENSVIMRLSNPELLQEVEAAKNALVQEQANFRRLKLNSERDKMTEQSALAEITAAVKAARMRREAEKDLAASGIVPKLAYQNTLLQLEQLETREVLQQQRIAKLKEVALENLIIQQEQLNQAIARAETAQQRADRLTVKAGLRGVLQRLPVALGQSVALGQELALVGSDKDLKVLIRVPQSKAESLKLGQMAEINTRREQVAGVITRIAPEVREGSIEVEMAFTEGVPASARPELNVDAQIFANTLSHILFIERPINTQSNSATALFRLSADGEWAQREQIRFGEEAGRFIQVLSGASEHDRIILSDMTLLADATRIHLINH